MSDALTENSVAVNVSNTAPTPKPTWEEFRNAQHGNDDERLSQFETNSERDGTTGRILNGPTGRDTELKVTFTMERVFSKYDTFINKEETWVLREFVTVVPPGKELEITRHSIVEPMDIWRFPREYARFKAGLDSGVSGTRLADWKGITNDKSLIKELAAVGIETVEQLASTGDQEGVRYIRAFLTWKAKAKAFINANIKTEAQVNLEQKMEDNEALHKAQLAALQATVDKLVTALSQKQVLAENTLPAKKSTYKRKVRAEDGVQGV